MPRHYFLKPVMDEDFLQVMANSQIKQQLKVPFLDIVSDGVALRLDTAELVYVDTCERTVQIHTTTGVLPVGRGFISLAEPLLEDERFLQCIKGVLVNMDYIEAVEYDIFLFKNDEKLLIALRNKATLIRQYRTGLFRCLVFNKVKFAIQFFNVFGFHFRLMSFNDIGRAAKQLHVLQRAPFTNYFLITALMKQVLFYKDQRHYHTGDH